jgi:hypothetical protein
MSPAERALWLRIQQRTSLLTPALRDAIVAAFLGMRAQMGEAALARAIEIGGAERVFREVLTLAVLDVAYQPVRERMRRTVIDSVRYFAKDVPKPPGPAGRVLTIGFDILNPRVIDAIHAMETRVITTVTDTVRDVLRQQVADGLQTGLGPRTIAKGLRESVGLAPNHDAAVRNFARMLREGDREALTRALRDKRFDGTLRTLFADGKRPTAQQVQTMTDAYRRKMVKWHAETVARTATGDALKLGQRLSWLDAADKGIVDRDRLMKQRIGVADARERDEHRAINDQVRHFDQPYSNGEMVSGDRSWNCRCADRYYIARAT